MLLTLEWHVGPLIGALFFGSGPSAIVRLIVPVVVDTVERIAGTWASAHVFKKCRERIAPALADLDATSTILGILLGPRVRAAGFHGGPDLIFGRPAKAVLSDHCEPSRASTIGKYTRNRAERVTRSPFARVVFRTKMERPGWSLAAIDRAGFGSLRGHLELILSGVTGQAVRAALPSHFTRMSVLAMPA